MIINIYCRIIYNNPNALSYIDKPIQFGIFVCASLIEQLNYAGCHQLFCLAFLDPRVSHTMDVLSPFISLLCHSD